MSGVLCKLRSVISIHPPRAGRDSAKELSTNFTAISIHPPRAGRDLSCENLSPLAYYFNPPSPCGEGLKNILGEHRGIEFQSTLPVRGGTTLCGHS